MIQIILLVCGILMLVLPGDKLVNKEKIKPNQSFEQVVKKCRICGIIIIILAVLMFF